MKRMVACGAFLLVGACAQDGVSGLPAADQIQAQRVERYFDSLGPSEAQVVQTWPDGALTTGTLDYAPGSMRVAYAPPHAMTMVAARGHIVLDDQASGAITRLSLARNPLGLLLRVPFRFSDGIAVTSVQSGAGWLQVSVAEADNPSQGRLTLQFSDQAGVLSLSGLNGMDARGHALVLKIGAWHSVASFPQATFADPD